MLERFPNVCLVIRILKLGVFEEPKAKAVNIDPMFELLKEKLRNITVSTTDAEHVVGRTV